MKRIHYSSFKKIFSLLCGSFFLLGSASIEAQDFHLSQYDASPLFLNPAMTGMFDGKYRMHLHYRTQWSKVSTKPFTTTGAAFDTPVKKFGIGLQVMNYRAGAGSYNSLSALLSASYDLASKTNMHHLAVGIQAGIVQKSISGDNLLFGNQYDAANGGGFNTTLSSGETFKNSSLIIPSVNAGLLYYYAKSNARLNPFLGFSAFNLTQPEETFFENGTRLPIRFYLHGGIKINVNEKIQLLPKVIYMQQLDNHELTASLLINYYLKAADTYFIIGPTYRHKDAAIIEVGIKKSSYTVRVSYDINTSPLKTVSYYHGGFEASFTYTVGKQKINPAINCPRL
jgi:type IX secretion system PorP/SprF family membrane protein